MAEFPHRVAFVQLGQRDPGFTRVNTLVIATGSGAVPYAAEKDAASPPGERLIDGAVAREPQVQNRPDGPTTGW